MMSKGMDEKPNYKRDLQKDRRIIEKQIEGKGDLYCINGRKKGY